VEVDPNEAATHLRIFVSYRRDDTSGYAGRIYDSLIDHFGEDQIFMDIDTIRPGQDFAEAIEGALAQCDVFLALIGRTWLTATDRQGRQRLADEADFVRLELEIALRRRIVIIPLLLQEAVMPIRKQLPDVLAEVATRQAMQLSDRRWRTDMRTLTEELDRLAQDKNWSLNDLVNKVDSSPQPRVWRRRPALFLATILGIVAVVFTLTLTSVLIRPTGFVAPSVKSKILVGSTPLWVALSPNGQYGYIVNASSSTISVIDTVSDKVLTTISVPGAGRVAITPDGRRAYVTSCPPFPNCAATTEGSVSVIDTASKSVISTLSTGLGPFGVSISPDGAHAYVVNRNSDTVSAIDTVTNTVTATTHVGRFPTGVAIGPDGRRAYVANATAGTVSVIDTASNSMLATISVGDGAFSIAVAPDNARAYVTNLNDGTVSVIDTSSDTVKAIIPVGSWPFGVALTPDGRYAYVTNRDSNNVAVIDTASNSVVFFMPAPAPDGIAISPDGRHGYITNSNSGTVSVFDTGIG
jgi:YVTN family beta-propeller protein